ncbi:MAG: hypothetical protein JWP89_2034 [Schlesneria sp.]|nr:hypothetical protein [Schlesneria sp.]
MRSNASERVRVHINEHKSHLGVSAHKCKSATYLLPNSFKSRSWRDDFATVNSFPLPFRYKPANLDMAVGTDQHSVLMTDHSS